MQRSEDQMPIQKSLWTKTICAYCGVGCGVEAKVNSKGLLDIRGDVDHPANYGKLCSKGLALGETVTHEGRLLKPSINGKNTDWSTAINFVASQFRDTIEEFGPDSVAFYASGQLLTEDYYVANKLMKGFIGSGNIDTNSRLCMSSSVVGHKRAFGSDTVPVCYQDLEKAEMVVLTGSNLAWCHPVLFQRLKVAKEKNPDLFIVVIDPRKTDSCVIADLHLAIQPGSDVTLFNGLLSYLAQSKIIDETYIQNYTEGFSSTIKSAIKESADNEALLKNLDITQQQLELFYQKFAQTEKVVTIYSQGVNQSSQGSNKVNSIINCHLATGRIGKQGMGPFSITGQPNAMGGREVGGLANTLAAHMEFNNPQEHQLISNFWNTQNLAIKAGLKAVDLFDAIHSGKIKAIWIMATNPAVSLPNSKKIKQALQKCPLVVVSDCIKDTATTRLANVLLPAQGWSEKSGTVTNSERRISRQRRILATPGEGKPDWWIISQVGKQMGYKDAFNFVHEGEVFSEHAKMTTLGNKDGLTRDLNLIGLTQLDAQGYSELKPQQWPVKKVQTEIVHQRMFSDNLFFTKSKKAQFIPVSFQQPLAQCTETFPLTLNSGRIRDHWHTMTRTGLSSSLSAHISEPFVSMNPFEALQHGLKKGDLVNMSSLHGSVLLRLSISDSMKKGQLFMPIHWNATTASKASVCSLIQGYTDSYSGQPEFKFTPVKIDKWIYNSEALLLSKTLLDLSQFTYWVKQKVGGGYLYRICDKQNSLQLKKELDQLLTKCKGKELNYSNNPKAEQPLYRYANIHKEQLTCAYILAPSLQNSELDWMQELLVCDSESSIERAILSGFAEGKLAQGKIICACKQVGINDITDAIKKQNINSVQLLSDCTGAGTGCGSCIPDLSNILAEQLQLSVAV